MISLGTKEIAKLIRNQLKAEFPACKFSVVKNSYSMGSSIKVSLMKADRKIKMTYDKIPESVIWDYMNRLNNYTEDELRNFQSGTYHQLNQYTIKGYHGDTDQSWCNGVFLTHQGNTLLKRVCQIADQYNYDDSDSMTDYYSVNFSFSIQLGKYNKAFSDGEGFNVDPELNKAVEARVEQIKINTEKARLEEEKKQDEVNQYRKLDKPNIPTGASHVIGGSGLRELTEEERRTGRINK